jgi:hypothetical protein
MKDLVEAIAKALVDYPDQVQVRAIEDKEVTIFEVACCPERFGKGNRPPRAHSRGYARYPERRRREAAKPLRARNP